MNLLKNKCIGGLFKSKWFPLVPQLFMLAAFILLIAGGLGITTNDSVFISELRYTNLANLIIWALWWPLIIIAAVFLGRLWCTICPMELITHLASKIGLKQQVPDFLKTGWVVTIFYAVIWIIGVQVLAINRVPHQMSLYMLFLIILAIDVSLLFQKRAFCSYICPIGHMLGLYSLISPFEWRADDLSTCENCKTKDCVTKENNYRLAGRSCTSNLYPATISNNRDCLLCTQCLKTCPNKNIRFSSRRPFSDFFRDLNLRPAPVGFIMLIGAFMVYEILSEWSVSYRIIMWVPEYYIDALGISGPIANLVWAISVFIILPVFLLLILGTLARLVSGRKDEPIFDIIKTFAILLLPTIAGSHVIKSILKMSANIPYWKHAISDPKGIEAARNILTGTIVLDSKITNSLEPVISVSIVTILLIALAATMRIFCQSRFVQKHSPGVKLVLLLSVLAYWTMFGLTIFNWRFG